MDGTGECYKYDLADDISPNRGRDDFIRDVREIYEEAGQPEGFGLYLFLDTTQLGSTLFYFNPIASTHCKKQGMFDHRGVACDKPIESNLCRLVP